jgi:hypothetical protein
MQGVIDNTYKNKDYRLDLDKLISKTKPATTASETPSDAEDAGDDSVPF